ncbi:MAG: ADP-forming succinate--CoA ligase subunit beta [Chloroflexi bacterium]|nr:ADP-forming succinate--CoA ligase subunit beta [Chloroflexota bacterium]
MKVHEYQAKAMMARSGIPVPRGEVASTPEEACAATSRLGGRSVLKAQVYAGGRGKAGGIQTANSPEEAEALARGLLGTRLVTHQTGPEGVPVNKLLVEEPVSIAGQLYLGIVIDLASRLPVMMASAAGGMDIEEVARDQPDKIIKVHVDLATGFRAYQGRKLAYGVGLRQELVNPAAALMASLYRLFEASDCSLAEINPLAITAKGELLAVDAKLNFDDNAEFRHKDLVEMRDDEQEDPIEVRAKKSGIQNYVKVDGTIGCMVNGAGLAMAVMDLITLCGGRAANFLDIGTANNTDRVVNSFRIFMADPSVRAILVNIFGGMARTDIIASGIVEAHRQLDITVPVVVRLAGTNVQEGKRILRESGLKLIEAADFKDAAEKAVAAVQGGKVL